LRRHGAGSGGDASAASPAIRPEIVDQAGIETAVGAAAANDAKLTQAIDL
jgi:hypothetical protein